MPCLCQMIERPSDLQVVRKSGTLHHPEHTIYITAVNSEYGLTEIKRLFIRVLIRITYTWIGCCYL